MRKQISYAILFLVCIIGIMFTVGFLPALFIFLLFFVNNCSQTMEYDSRYIISISKEDTVIDRKVMNHIRMYNGYKSIKRE